MIFLYSINLPVSLLSTVLSFLSGKRLYANFLGARCRGTVLRYVIIASWVLGFTGNFLLCVLCTGGSSVSFLIMCWAANHEDRHLVSGCSTLGCGATLGGVAFQGTWGLGMRLNR